MESSNIGGTGWFGGVGVGYLYDVCVCVCVWGGGVQVYYGACVFSIIYVCEWCMYECWPMVGFINNVLKGGVLWENNVYGGL